MKTIYRCLVLTVLVALCVSTVGCGPERAPEGTATKPADAVIPMGPGGMPAPPGAETPTQPGTSGATAPATP
jgi:hypothetical protein